jgi:hypothetical protein
LFCPTTVVSTGVKFGYAAVETSIVLIVEVRNSKPVKVYSDTRATIDLNLIAAGGVTLSDIVVNAAGHLFRQTLAEL